MKPRSAPLIALAAALMASSSAGAAARPGTLDRSFGGDGVAKASFATTVPAAKDSAWSVVAEPDGKILAVGDSSQDFALARYAANGSLDPSFGTGGRVVTDLGVRATARGAVVQPDGKVLVVGGAGGDFAVARYQADGTLDSTFGHGGIVTVDLGGNDQANAVTLVPNGDIVVVGQRGPRELGSKVALVRLHGDGRIDRSFGKRGVAIGPPGTGQDVARQPDGKLVVAIDGFQFGAVARFRRGGGLDPSFGDHGVFETKPPRADLPYVEGYESLALQPNGKIVTAGVRLQDEGSDVAVVTRLTAAGKPDRTFAGSGTAAPLFDAYGVGVAVERLPVLGHRIVVGASGDGGRFVATRLEPDGSTDQRFGNRGEASVAIGEGGEAHGAALTAAGLVVAGGDGTDFALASFGPGGPDPGFGSGGVVRTDFGPGHQRLSAQVQTLATAPGGKLVVIGSAADFAASPIQYRPALARFGPAGVLDPSLGGGGTIVGPSASAGDKPGLGGALQGDGKIVVAGAFAGRLALTRYEADGGLDPNFGQGGTELTGISLGRGGIGKPGPGKATAVRVDASGQIVVAAPFGGGSLFRKVVLARFEPNGQPDPTYGGGDGWVLTTVPGSAVRCDGALGPPAFAPDGGIALACGAHDWRDIAVARIDPDGKLDRAFGDGGTVITRFAGHRCSHCLGLSDAVAVQADGRIVAAGGVGGVIALARYKRDGSLDRSFGGDGRAVVVAHPFHSSVVALAFDSRRRILALGNDQGSRLTLARFWPGGGIDRRFGHRGTAIAKLGPVTIPAALAIEADGKIVAAGTSDQDPFVARFSGG